MPDAPVSHARVSAWAKVNLDLRILTREASGFHQLETLFQRISLSDQVDVRIAPGSGITLQCVPDVGVPPEQNLAVRAAQQFRNATHWPPTTQCIEITIAKQIPTGAGLGGGSADAAAVLRALNALSPNPISLARMLQIAAQLGSDVPFLTTESALALAWGRGERLLALSPLPRREIHLALFADGVNTAEAYRALAEAREQHGATGPMATMLTVDRLQGWQETIANAENDFEPTVFARRDDIGGVHRALSALLPGALVRLSGSGATVFAVTERQDGQPAIADAVTQCGAAYVRAETLERIPPVTILSRAS
jgi:4-diphosphocytidyl-2-C-methyl-D-erythritol kinase